MRCYRNVLDALASFGKEMPSTAVVGPLAPHPANALLIEDLEQYGVPVVRALPASRHGGQRRSASVRENSLHRYPPAVRRDIPVHR